MDALFLIDASDDATFVYDEEKRFSVDITKNIYELFSKSKTAAATYAEITDFVVPFTNQPKKFSTGVSERHSC